MNIHSFSAGLISTCNQTRTGVSHLAPALALAMLACGHHSAIGGAGGATSAEDGAAGGAGGVTSAGGGASGVDSGHTCGTSNALAPLPMDASGWVPASSNPYCIQGEWSWSTDAATGGLSTFTNLVANTAPYVAGVGMCISGTTPGGQADNYKTWGANINLTLNQSTPDSSPKPLNPSPQCFTITVSGSAPGGLIGELCPTTGTGWGIVCPQVNLTAGANEVCVDNVVRPSYCDTTAGLTCYTTDQLKAGVQMILVQGAAGAQGGAIDFCVTSIVPHDPIVLDAGTVGGMADAGAFADAPVITIARNGGTPISPFAFGNNYYDWIDFNQDGKIGILGTEAPVKALKLNVIVANSNNTDSNRPELFDDAQIDAYIQYCRAVGAEPMMEVPIDGNNVDAGPTSAQGAADMVTYVNVTKGYGVKYWTIGDEVDNYPAYFAGQGITPNVTIPTAADYCAIYKSYAIAMQAANAAANNGFDLKFVGPELAGAYIPGWDWLTPFLDGCKDYVDVASIHAYGFSGTQLSVNGALTGVQNYRQLLSNVKSIVAQHARPGIPLAVTEVSISYDWDPKQFSQASIQAAPGTFYAAMWDADIMGSALEANLWTLAFWDLAETVQSAPYSVFGFLHTDPSVSPPTYKATPEYYAQQMVSTNFSGTTVVPSGVPSTFSVYASYDASKASTAVLVINKNGVAAPLSLAVDSLVPQTVLFDPMTIALVTIPDDSNAGTHMVEYTSDLAEAGLPPKTIR
jgi:hypothetical protein